jgi:hypothetical protein
MTPFFLADQPDQAPSCAIAWVGPNLGEMEKI